MTTFRRLATLAFATLVAASSAARAATLTTIAEVNSADTTRPRAGLTFDPAGNLYGTTGGSGGGGTAFRLAAGTNAYSTIATFTSPSPNAIDPRAPLISDAAGNLYGTTYFGGTGRQGTAFRITAGTNALTLLAQFDGSNGANPIAGLIADTAGNLYGTTANGGTGSFGTAFRIAAGTNVLTTIANFNGTAGSNPVGRLSIDTAGNLYGTTTTAGPGGSGTVFRIAAGTNALTTIAIFNDANGAAPRGTLAIDAAGNVYGTAGGGGPGGNGTVFKIDAVTNALTTLATFDKTNTGWAPYSGVIIDAAGNLFGTADFGGPGGGGTVFKVTAGTNALTTLATFNGTNGSEPLGALIADAAGNLYGTTISGSPNGRGTAFKVTGSGFVVPEPATLSLATIGAALLRRRRA